jgi:hypothetical protein
MQCIEQKEGHAERIRRKVNVTFNHMSTTWPTLFSAIPLNINQNT